MKTLKIIFVLMILSYPIFAQDIIVNICPLQETLPISVDRIEVYNETNGSYKAFENLPQYTTEYSINLNNASIVDNTTSQLIETDFTNKIFIYQSNTDMYLSAVCSNSENAQITIYNLNGQLLYTEKVSVFIGKNSFRLPLYKNQVVLVNYHSSTINKSFKTSGSNSNSLFVTDTKTKTTSPLTYSTGDRVLITITKSNLISRQWAGQPENGDDILIAIPKSDQEFDMAQTLSTGAQVNTISFSGVAFYTGCFYASTFYPPGKVADYFGFQYFRDNDPDEGGHNTDFLTKAAYHMIQLLDDDQLGVLIDLAEEQCDLIDSYAYARMPIIKAFHRYLDGDLPEGTTTLCADSVIAASKDVYLIDAEISYGRAKAFSTVIKSFTQEQKDYLYALNVVGMQTWSMPEKPDRNIPKDLNVYVMSNASEMFSWFLGSLEADTYFCPERQGTYFGGFFMKDAPAMGNAGYAIDPEATAGKGAYMLDNILDDTQEQLIRGIYSELTDELDSIKAYREKISVELRKFWMQDEIDKQAIFDWSAKYGEFDGTYIYTMADRFVQVANTLTTQQYDDLLDLRDLEDFPCKVDTVFLYSKEIEEPVSENTDKFFE